MTEVTQQDIADVLTEMVARFSEELFSIENPAGLDRFWFYSHDAAKSQEHRLYAFHKALTIYGNQCRRWEERKNGSCCVVERVRDTYLMPKIRHFVDEQRQA